MTKDVKWPTPREDCFSPAELAEAGGITLGHLRQQMRWSPRGFPERFKVGDKVFFPKAGCKAWLARRKAFSADYRCRDCVFWVPFWEEGHIHHVPGEADCTWVTAGIRKDNAAASAGREWMKGMPGKGPSWLTPQFLRVRRRPDQGYRCPGFVLRPEVEKA